MKEDDRLNIIACIKSVRPDLVNGGTVHDEDFEINPYDLFALQSVVDLKEKNDCNITCVSMGANIIKNSLIKSYAIGADKVIWLNDSLFAGSDTVATSYILYKAIKDLDYDLIVCGGIAVDGETGQVPAGLSERLNIRCIAGVREIIELSDEYVIVRRTNEHYEEVIKAKLPVVLAFDECTTVTKNFGLVALKRAQRKDIIIETAEDLEIDSSRCGLKGSKTKVLGVTSNFQKKDAVKICGKPIEAAELIYKITSGKNGV